ncbi:DNA repair protein RecO [Candidatus Riflebacteria bacterium]
MIKKRKHYKDRAIILKNWRIAEKDLLVSFFSENYGPGKGVAKGARHNPSRFGPFLGPSSMAIFHFYQGPHRLHITGCDGLFSLQNSAITPEYSWQVQELLSNLIKFLVEEKKQPRLFGMTEKLILFYKQHLNPPPQILDAYYVKLLTFMGICPSLKSCNLCNVEWKNETDCFYSASRGKLICESCLPTVAESAKWIHLPAKKFMLLKILHCSPFDKLIKTDFPIEAHRAVRHFYRLFFNVHLSIELEMNYFEN